MRITLIVLWWAAVALTVAHFLMNLRVNVGMDFYVQGITNVLLAALGPLALVMNNRSLLYSVWFYYVIEWFWKLYMLSDFIDFTTRVGLTNPVVLLWGILMVLNTAILILVTLLVFNRQNPLNLASHLLSISEKNNRLFRIVIPVTIALLGFFIYFALQQQLSTIYPFDKIRLALFIILLVLYLTGVAFSKFRLITLTMYFSFGVFLFCSTTTVSYTIFAIKIPFVYGYSSVLSSNEYLAFCMGGLYFLVTLPLFIRILMKLSNTAIDTQQLDQF